MYFTISATYGTTASPRKVFLPLLPNGGNNNEAGRNLMNGKVRTVNKFRKFIGFFQSNACTPEV